MKSIVLLAVITLSCSACTAGGGGGGSALTRDECEALIRKGWQMNDVPFDGDVATTAFEKSIQNCTMSPRLFSRKMYECMMRANTTEDFATCGGRK
jgi:hypothetical protein